MTTTTYVCPKCNSPQVKVVEEEGLDFVTCRKCGYDENKDEASPGMTRRIQNRPENSRIQW